RAARARLGGAGRAGARPDAQVLDPLQLVGGDGRKAPAFGPPRAIELRQRPFEPVQQVLGAGGSDLFRLVRLARLEDALDGEYVLDPRRRGIDPAGEPDDRRQHPVKRLLVELKRRLRLVAADLQRHVAGAAGDAAADPRAHFRLETLVARGQPAADVEAAPIDRLDLPLPTDPVALAAGGRKAGHAG